LGLRRGRKIERGRPRFARALRWRRVLNGWSQEALGLAAGLDSSYVGSVD